MVNLVNLWTVYLHMCKICSNFAANFDYDFFRNDFFRNSEKYGKSV